MLPRIKITWCLWKFYHQTYSITVNSKFLIHENNLKLLTSFFVSISILSFDSNAFLLSRFPKMLVSIASPMATKQGGYQDFNQCSTSYVAIIISFFGFVNSFLSKYHFSFFLLFFNFF